MNGRMVNALVECLEPLMWNQSYGIAQEAYKAVWWMRNLAVNADDEKSKYLQRTARHQIFKLQSEVKRSNYPDGNIIAELDGFLEDMTQEWFPTPESLRINSFPLVEDFSKLVGEIHVTELVFANEVGKNTWYGYCQYKLSAIRKASCPGEIACRSVMREDGVGGSAIMLVPLAVRLKKPQPIPGVENDIKDDEEWFKFLKKHWSDDDLFEPHDFVRVHGYGPAAGEITTIQRRTLKGL